MLHRQQANILGLYSMMAKVGFLFFMLFLVKKTPEQWIVMHTFALLMLWMEAFGIIPQKNISGKEIFSLWRQTTVLLLIFKASMMIAGFSSIKGYLDHLSTMSFLQMCTDQLFLLLRPILIYTVGFVVLTKLTRKPRHAHQVA